MSDSNTKYGGFPPHTKLETHLNPNRARPGDLAPAAPVICFLLALFLPLIGFFSGVWLCFRKQPGLGCAVMATSLAAIAGWTILLRFFIFHNS